MLPSDGRLEMSQSPVNQPLSVSNTPSVLDTKTPRAVPGQDLIAHSRPAAGHARPWIAAVWAHKWLTLGIAILIAFGAWHTAHTIFGPAVVVDRATRGDLVQTVVAIGHIETPYRVEIASRITGTVEAVLVDEGQEVKRGQPLISIEAGELRAAVVQAEAAVAQAEARLRQLREVTQPAGIEDLTQAQATLTNAQQVYDRVSTLTKSGNAPKASLDDAQKNLEIARTRVRAAEFQVYSTGPGGSEYVTAETLLDQAKANLQTSRSRLGYATISAPRDGLLIARRVEAGSVVQPGQGLLVLAPTGDVQVVVQVDERNLAQLSLGQKALASAEAYPGRTFPAIVTYINPSVDLSRASVEVKLTVPEPPAYLRQDMTTSVDIEVARQRNTIALPITDINEALTDTPWVMTVRGGRARRQPVKLGIRGKTHVEILDGLGEGDLVIPRGGRLNIGQPLRPVAP